MRRSLCGLMVIAGALGSGGASAQEIPWANKFFTFPQQPPPVIFHDFGTAPRGAVLKHSFPVTNIYQVPIRIGEIRTSCGCVTATVPNPTLGITDADKVGAIVIEMDGRKFVGEKEVTVYVPFIGASADGKQFFSTALVRVKAFARTDVTVTPGQIDFGVVAQTRPQPEIRTVNVVSLTQNNWRLTDIVNNPDSPFEVNVQPAQAPGGQLSYQVSVALKPEAPAGPISDEVVLKTNDPASPEVRIRVAGLVQAPLLVTPNAVRFGSVRVNDSRITNVLVRGSRPFKLVRVEGAGDGVSVQLPSHAALVHPVPITFRPAGPGPIRRQLQIVTDLDGGSVATVTVEATGE